MLRPGRKMLYQVHISRLVCGSEESVVALMNPLLGSSEAVP